MTFRKLFSSAYFPLSAMRLRMLSAWMPRKVVVVLRVAVFFVV